MSKRQQLNEQLFSDVKKGEIEEVKGLTKAKVEVNAIGQEEDALLCY